MGIRRLISNHSETSKISLSGDSAIILVEKSNAKTECIHIEVDESISFDKLKNIDDVCTVKYIGTQEIFDKVSALSLNWPEFSKKVITTDEVTAYFYSGSGKVRISKQEKSDMGKKRVLIVDDSKTIQKLISKIIQSSSQLEVMDVANGPREAREIIEKSRPDLITLDIHMPEMTGVDFLKTYLKDKNIPTVMISSVSMNEGPLVMEALSNGAMTYIQKPSISEMGKVGPDILKKLEAISSKQLSLPSNIIQTKTKINFDSLGGLIAIGSSTGGTQAIQEILTALPDNIPPIVIVQHIPAVFSKALSDRLNKLCPFTVKEAQEDEFIKENTVYIAPGDKQFKLLKRGKEKRVQINDDPPLNRFRPSVDYLFNSITKLEEEHLVGIILTGMGSDGAHGLLELKKCGAFTLAQDESSCVVFGMPKEAIGLGAAMKVVSLNNMSTEMVLAHNKVLNKKAA